MRTHTTPMRSRWLDWHPDPQILADILGSEPSKPIQLGSVGFDGSYSGATAKIEIELDTVQASLDVLNGAGVRIMHLAGAATIGVWNDLDGPEIRSALRTLEMDGLPVRHLDEDGIPSKYKYRKIDGGGNA